MAPRLRPGIEVRPAVRFSDLLAALLISAATLIAYHNSFPGALVFDDASSITENASIRKLWPLTSVLAPPSEAGVGGRPFANLTFALNHAISGLHPGGFHAVNLALHLATALTLFAVLKRTLLQPTLREQMGNVARPLAMSVAALWAVHPLATSVVNYASQRTEILAALFTLLTLYGVIRAADSGQRRWQILGVAACAAGMASKEVMIAAPVLVIFYDRAFLSGSWWRAWQIRKRFYLGLALTWILLGGLLITSHVAERGVGFGLGVSWTDYALTQVGAVLRYLKLALWPAPLVFDYGWAFERNATTAAGCFVLLGVIIASGVFAVKRWPPVGFAACAVFLYLAPTSSVIPIVQQPIAETRMYLPLAAILALVCAAAIVVLRRLSAVPLVFGIVASIWLTIERNEDYRNEIALWSDTVAKQPENARAHSNLSAALLRADRLAEAIAEASTATQLMPQYAQAHHNLALALVRSGRVTEGIEHYETALRVAPEFVDAHYNLGEALAQAGRAQEALGRFETVLRLNPRHARAHNNLAVVLLDLGRAAEAAAHARSALELEPRFAEAHYNLGNALARMNEPLAARASFEAALRLQPGFAKAHHNLGVLYLNAGDRTGALRCFQRALELDPAYDLARKNLELVTRQAPISDAK